MKWLGRGHTGYGKTVKGPAVWCMAQDYNNTSGETELSEFKGYHADCIGVIENKESPFTVYTDDQSIFLQMLKRIIQYEHESLKAAFPEGI